VRPRRSRRFSILYLIRAAETIDPAQARTGAPNQCGGASSGKGIRRKRRIQASQMNKEKVVAVTLYDKRGSWQQVTFQDRILLNEEWMNSRRTPDRTNLLRRCAARPIDRDRQGPRIRWFHHHLKNGKPLSFWELPADTHFITAVLQ